MFDKPVLSNLPICQTRQIPNGGHNCLNFSCPNPGASMSSLSKSPSPPGSLPRSLSWRSPAMHELSPCLGPWSSLWPGYLQIFVPLLWGDDLHQFQILFQACNNFFQSWRWHFLVLKSSFLGLLCPLWQLFGVAEQCYLYTVWPDGRANPPGDGSSHTFCMFQFKRSLWLRSPKAHPSRFTPGSQYEVYSMNSPLTACHVLVGWITGLCILCNEQRQAGMGPGACLASCAPVRACQPEGGMSPCNSAAQERLLFVICTMTLSARLWQVLGGVVYFCILIVSSGSQPRVSIAFVFPTGSLIPRENTDHAHVS